MKPRSKTPTRRLDPATLHFLKQFAWGFLTVSVCALIITSIWYGTRLSVFTIDTVTAEGGITIQPHEVISRADEALSGAYLKLVPRRFAYLYPKEDIIAMVNEIPHIKDVAVNRTGMRTITVSYGEYVPDALWCENKESNTCLFLDENAFGFGEAPDLKGGSLIRYYAFANPLTIGSTPFSIDDYKQTKDFAERLAETGWFVSSVEIDSVRDVFYTLVGGGELKVTLSESNERTLGYLNTIRTSEEFSHLVPGNFEYIDLRFGAKVFVNEVIPISEEVTSSSTDAVELAEQE